MRGMGGRDAMDEGPNEHWDGRARPVDSDVWMRTDRRWVKIWVGGWEVGGGWQVFRSQTHYEEVGGGMDAFRMCGKQQLAERRRGDRWMAGATGIWVGGEWQGGGGVRDGSGTE